jgi:hypothetical protein
VEVFRMSALEPGIILQKLNYIPVPRPRPCSETVEIS